MQLNDGEVHIWSVPLDISDAEANTIAAHLNEQELTRAKRLINPADQTHFIAAHAALRQILSMYLEIPPNTIAFAYTAHKKPYLDKDASLSFNMTHSGTHAAIAITKAGHIGIDIEKLTEHNKIAVAERYFSPHEIQQLHQLDPKQQIAAFYHLWACKEAVIKANGKGLSIPLHSFSVSLTNDPFDLELENKRWKIIPFDLINGYKSALALDTPVDSLTYCEFSWQNSTNRKTIDL